VASHAGGNAEEWHNVWVPGHETERAIALNIVASELWTVAQAGRVALTQRRRAPLVCDYIATLKSNSPAGKEMPSRVSARTGQVNNHSGHIQRTDLVSQ
jgi:hypothetical protein